MISDIFRFEHLPQIKYCFIVAGLETSASRFFVDGT